MTNYSKEHVRRASYSERLRLYNLIQDGMTLQEALNIVMPPRNSEGKRINSSRMARIKAWEKRGLYPPSQREITEHHDVSIDRPISRGRPQTSCSPRTVPMSFRIPVPLAEHLRSLEGTLTEHVINALNAYLEAEVR